MRLVPFFLSLIVFQSSYVMSELSLLSEEGLKVEVTKKGNGGQKSKNGDKLFMHYKGTLTDGSKFDASYDRGEPFSFKLGVGQVISAWEKGMQDMEVGEHRKLTADHQFAYGERGFPPVIPPKATLSTH